ncbi:MAG: type II secretion system protein [Candidatus Omnitrophica bacterium]|nr:type II secretion system protein [Candidatus Omnitrophota bacterium]
MKRGVSRSGMTLVEVLISVLLLIATGGALLLGMHHASVHADYLSQFQVAMNAAQGELEQLASTSFDTLWAMAQASPNGQCMGIGEDANCNGALDAGEDTNGNGVLDELLSGGRLAVEIKSADTRNPPSLLDLHVAACWTARGRRIGEDANCNGALDAGEDTNGNGWVDSPVMVSTRVARRD